MYTNKEIANAEKELNGYSKRPEDMKFSLYKEALKEQNLKVNQHKLGMFFHVSAQLIPKIEKDGRITIPTQWIGKTKGKTYVNIEKQESRRLEMFAYYMSIGEVEKAEKLKTS